MKISFDEIPEEVRSVLISMFLVAIKMDEMGLNQEDFMTMAMEVWESMKKNDIYHLKQILQSQIQKEAEKFVDVNSLK